MSNHNMYSNNNLLILYTIFSYLISVINGASSFYLPGVTPNSFQQGETVNIYYIKIYI